MFTKIKPTPKEIASAMPGDDIVPNADVIMDRAFTVPGTTAEVWPWFNQLGKNRSGWYLPKSIEKFIPQKKRAVRYVEPKLQDLSVGNVIDDWGGKNETFEVAILDPPYTLVHKSKRGNTNVSWAITLRDIGDNQTRVQLRLRLFPVKYKWLAKTIGEAIDILTIAGLATGLRERLSSK